MRVYVAIFDIKKEPEISDSLVNVCK